MKTDYPKLESLLKENKIEITSHRVISASLENVFIHLVTDKD